MKTHAGPLQHRHPDEGGGGLEEEGRGFHRSTSSVEAQDFGTI